ncbi:hypothetical protein RMN57_27400 [Kitasatospora sp. CM 4170]|uniref:hypothetical protein n=1 Tax=Kitasatospora TaxID=2063 RepID=UPI0028B1F7B5|nr:hypothetical protein [Kitasatospora sp. CM 4170]WNM48148.1 hypothetical protein RMN57_27400 [Kitasatospora sp. CM 4170]
MAVREDTGQGAPYGHGQQHERRGRHGRPKPFGGRLRLPTLRFSGAAMAMSTVVGISIATTFLLNEQQGVGRRAGVSRVGSTPPPTPDTGDGTDDAAAAPHDRTAPPPGRPGVRPAEAPSPSAAVAHPPASGGPAPQPSAPATSLPLAEGGRAARADAGRSSGPSAEPLAAAPDGRATATGGTATPGTAATDPATADPSGTPSASPSASPSTTQPATQPGSPQPAKQQPASPRPLLPGTGAPGPQLPDVLTTGADQDGRPADGAPGPARPGGPGDGTGTGTGTTTTGGPTDQENADLALTGSALVQPLGRDGSHHVLTLTVTEPVTALQAEFRLSPGGLAPGSGTAWTDLPGAVATVQQERGTLVYRFTTPPGTDVRPGRYGFGVRGVRPLPAAEPLPTGAPLPAATVPGRPGPGILGPSAPSGPTDRTGPSTPTDRTGATAPTGVSRTTAPKAPAVESWNAAAFAIDHPRAVAALGTFAAAPR